MFEVLRGICKKKGADHMLWNFVTPSPSLPFWTVVSQILKHLLEIKLLIG
jgi:hypothetical protein